MVFENIKDSEQNLPAMIQRIKEASLKLPKQYTNVLIFDRLAGLRSDEACKGIYRIHSATDSYFSRKTIYRNEARKDEYCTCGMQ